MKKKIFYIILVCIGLSFAVLVVLLFDIYKNKDITTDMLTYCLSENKILLYRMKSGNNKWLYATDIHINKQGFRDKDFDTKLAENKIICLGDSITFAGMLSTEDRYTEKLSKMLGEKYCVYNLGVDGYNTIQEAENLKEYGLKYKPDIVIVVYCLNDIENFCDPIIYYALKANFCKLNVFLCNSKLYRNYVYLPLIKYIEGHKKDVQFVISDMYRKYGEIDVSEIEDDEIGIRIISELQKKYEFKCYFFIIPFFRNFENYKKEDENIHLRLSEIFKKYPNLKLVDLKNSFMNVTKNDFSFRKLDRDYIHPNEYGHGLIAKFIYENLKQDGAID